MSRYDHSAFVMTTTQKPMVSTWYGRQIAPEGLTYGANLIVAIACFTGYNQEDGVLVNKTSLQRGLFRTLKLVEEVAEEEDNQKTKTKILFRDPRTYAGIKLKSDAEYGYLDEDGLLPEGTMIKPGMVLFGMIAEQDGETPKDISIVAGRFDSGMVDARVIIRLPGGLRRVRYRVSKFRMVEFGDKFSSRAGQKGTCGMLVDAVDMPRTVNGIVPDLIVNPHAIPSRMTIAQLQESVMCKLGSLIGLEIDSTAFTHNGAFSEDVGRILKDNGYDPAGDEMLYSGVTGEMLPTKIFIGPTYYMRLKHMVQDKINYRPGDPTERGPIDSKTRQPVGGRAREGGLRIGEMERDAIISHGASRFLQESQTLRADGEMAYYCGESGKRGFYGDGKNLSVGFRSVERDGPMEFQGTTAKTITNTRSYTNSKQYSRLTFPRSLSLLFNELETMGIDSRIVTDTAMGDLVRPEIKVKLPEEMIDELEEQSEKLKSHKKIQDKPIELPGISTTTRKTARRPRLGFVSPQTSQVAPRMTETAPLRIGEPGGEGEVKNMPEQEGLGRRIAGAEEAVHELEKILEDRKQNVRNIRDSLRHHIGRGLLGQNIAHLEQEGSARRESQSLIASLASDSTIAAGMAENIVQLGQSVAGASGHDKSEGGDNRSNKKRGGLLSSLKIDQSGGGGKIENQSVETPVITVQKLG